MVQVIQAQEVSLEQLEQLFGLQLVSDPTFFYEWQEDLPELTDWQRDLLDQIAAGYLNLLRKPPLLEKPINLAVVSPLLFTRCKESWVAWVYDRMGMHSTRVMSIFPQLSEWENDRQLD
jgi:hypothetical protein